MNKEQILALAAETKLVRRDGDLTWGMFDPEQTDITDEVLAFAAAVRRAALDEAMAVLPRHKHATPEDHAVDIDSVAHRAMQRIWALPLMPPTEQSKSGITHEVRSALMEFWPSVYRTPDAERERFEQATYAHYLERHAAGKLADSDASAGTREQLLWRKEDGEYGVLMFNASWWAWQKAVAL